MITADCILLIIAAFFTGLTIGWMVTYCVMLRINSNACNHEFEHISTYEVAGCRTKAFMCMKCGKVKKVRY